MASICFCLNVLNAFCDKNWKSLPHKINIDIHSSANLERFPSFLRGSFKCMTDLISIEFTVSRMQIFPYSLSLIKFFVALLLMFLYRSCGEEKLKFKQLIFCIHDPDDPGLSWWRHQMETFHWWIPLTKTSDAELWCLLWSAHEQTVEQIIETPVIWDTIVFIMTSL